MLNDLAAFHKGLSEPVRIRIVYLLMKHKHLCACEIESALDESQSKVSRHLQYLVNNSCFVNKFKKEKWSYYFISDSVKKNPVLLDIVKLIEEDKNSICELDLKRLNEMECNDV
ncbi:MAG: ArsR/SmtB family transcription factor [Candidatus Muiribacteriota bacterium]